MLSHSRYVTTVFWPGGHLHFKLDIILVKKNYVIRVVFQDWAMYARASFRCKKRAKLEKKGVFLVITTNFLKGQDGQIRENACKNTYLGSI